MHKALSNLLLRKMFFVLSRAWDKEKILSPLEESNLRPSDSALLLLLKSSDKDKTWPFLYVTRLIIDKLVERDNRHLFTGFFYLLLLGRSQIDSTEL